MNPVVLRECGVVGCAEPAAWQPVLVVHFIPCGPDCGEIEPQFVTDPAWLLCDGHKERCCVERLMCGDRWAALAIIFEQHGMHAPDPHRAIVEYRALVAGEA